MDKEAQTTFSCLFSRHEGVRGLEVYIHSFLNLDLDRVKWSTQGLLLDRRLGGPNVRSKL